jgi:hypothetical protein
MNGPTALLSLVALAACAPEVNVGTDVKEETLSACDPVTPPTLECPAAPWGARLAIDSVSSLTTQLSGRWAFCGGEKRYTGRGPMVGFALGSGIEVFSESGQLRYAFLEGSDRVRTNGPSGTGTVRPLVDQGRGSAVLTSDDGQQVVWQTDFFETAPVMQNGAFDVWNFVRTE